MAAIEENPNPKFEDESTNNKRKRKRDETNIERPAISEEEEIADMRDNKNEYEESEKTKLNDKKKAKKLRREKEWNRSGIMTEVLFCSLRISELKEMGFQYMTQRRQTAILSASHSKKVEDLASLSFRTTPVYIDVDDRKKRVTNEGLEQGYCVVPCAKRFLLLYSFLHTNRSKKGTVFFSSCNSVKFHSELLNFIGMDCFSIHGKQKQQKRTSSFIDFCKAERGFLLCTDFAACGLDIPSVDWIVQYDPPYEPKEYISRVCRTACCLGAKGNALLFLIPEELQFVQYLKDAEVPVKKYGFKEKKLKNVQPQLERLVASNYNLNKSAKDAYRSYMIAYSSHYMKHAFKVHRLDLQAVATSFCLHV